MSHRWNITAMLTLSFLPGSLWAAESDALSLSFDGFGTLGVVHSDYEQADFVTANPLQRSGVGYSRSWGTAQDSKLGVQLSAELGRLSAVVQGLTQLRYDNTFKPALEWANLKYAITPDFNVRLGRVVLPTFLSSDTENVGYARPWVRTPGEIRVQLPQTNSDGVDVNYSFNIGKATHQLQLLFGKNREASYGEVFKNKRIRTLTDTIEYGHLTVHLGYQNALRDPPSPGEYSFKAFDIGAAYDPGNWYVIAEQFSTSDEAMGHIRARSLGGGYRFGDVTPYLIASRIQQTSIGTLEQEPLFNQRTVAVGIRWDFARNLDLKLQYETIRIGSVLSPTSFINLQPGVRTGDRAHVFSATVDFVW